MEVKEKEEIISEAKHIIEKHKVQNFEPLEIRDVNHRPHVPVIGPATIKYANDKRSMYITEDAPCCHPGCNLSIGQHKADTVLFFKLTGEVLKEEANAVLIDVVDGAAKDKIDGFAFVQENKNCKFV